MLWSALVLAGAAALASAHTIITYPGWRGDNLITNDQFPYGMQWMYPCELLPAPPRLTGLDWLRRRPQQSNPEPAKLTERVAGGGMNTTTNRTFWPTTGGAIALQPGWFQGHAQAQLFINLGFGTDGPDGGPKNMSNVMVPQFGILGPSKNPYPGTICLPQVPLPVNTTVNPGDNATIQVVELAVHGAALFSVRAALLSFFLSSAPSSGSGSAC